MNSEWVGIGYQEAVACLLWNIEEDQKEPQNFRWFGGRTGYRCGKILERYRYPKQLSEREVIDR